MSGKGEPCQNCGQRPATDMWVGNGGTLAVSHGFYDWWCHPCVLQAQINHCRQMVEELPRLEAELEAALQ